jgi:membrane fusion protein (multidrug efflux system)
LLAGLLGALSLICGCQDQKGASAGGPPPPAVATITLSPQDLAVTREYVGFVEGRQVVEVRAQVDGLLTSRDYQEGEWVEKGQTLFKIDDARYRSMVDQAEARARGAKNVLALAERDAESARRLNERGSVAPRDLYAAETELSNAMATVEAAEAALAEAKTLWEMTSVRAPVSGFAGAAEQMEGSLIVASSPTGGLLTSIYDVGEVRVVFAVPEVHVRAIRQLTVERGAKMAPKIDAEILFDSEAAYPHKGLMEYGNAAVDRSSGSMLARAVFPNPDLELYNGQIVRLRLALATIPDVLSVPQTALMLNQSGKALALLDDEDRVVFQPVEAYGPIDGRFMIKPEGLVQAGARVIVEGLNKVRPGSAVLTAAADDGGQPSGADGAEGVDGAEAAGQPSGAE